jgi:hypothetical protein
MIGKPFFRGDCSALPTYRLYRLDGAGKITAADWIEADDDAGATRQAQEQAASSGGFYELWERNRLVGRNRAPRG